MKKPKLIIGDGGVECHGIHCDDCWLVDYATRDTGLKKSKFLDAGSVLEKFIKLHHIRERLDKSVCWSALYYIEHTLKIKKLKEIKKL